MYTVTVRDHMMIAHSLHGVVFGPSQRIHGATFVVDAAFSGRALDADGIVVDIGLAAQKLRTVLDRWDRRNLDDVAEFAGANTTTELVAGRIADLLAEECMSGRMGDAAMHLAALTVTVHESPVAWASYRHEFGT